MKKTRAVYPGSFDPLTHGHFDIIKRSFHLVDELIIAVIDNPNKTCTFSTEEREKMIRELMLNEGFSDRVSVVSFKGLLVSFLEELDISLIIRGIRALSDFEFEFRASRMNKHLGSDIETIFILSAPEYEHISSSLIKEVHRLGGNVSYYLPQNILECLISKTAN